MRNRKNWRPSVFFCLALTLPGAACGSEVSQYKPFAANGAIIYHEACARCHDEATDAPLLLHGEIHNLTRETIEDALANGGAGMPSYPLIEGESREALVVFILNRRNEGGL